MIELTTKRILEVALPTAYLLCAYLIGRRDGIVETNRDGYWSAGRAYEIGFEDGEREIRERVQDATASTRPMLAREVEA